MRHGPHALWGMKHQFFFCAFRIKILRIKLPPRYVLCYYPHSVIVHLGFGVSIYIIMSKEKLFLNYCLYVYKKMGCKGCAKGESVELWRKELFTFAILEYYTI